MVGEIVRAMARKGWPAVSFRANNDFQRVEFKAITDPVLSSVYITLDRKTGSGAMSAALVGSKATIGVTCEVRNFLADPDDLVAMYRTDLANLFKMSWGDVKINHEYNAIMGTTAHVIDIVCDSEAGLEASPELVESWRRLVQEAGALFGARHSLLP